MKYLLIVLFSPYFLVAQNSQRDTTTFSTIYTNIFVTKCAVPACHDGSFEPDLRTLSGAYATLVYHPIIKNNTKKTFKYRVTPFDTNASVLYERITNCCFVNKGDQMPFTLGTTLSHAEIAAISEWINQGAKDPSGMLHLLINTPPYISDGYNVFFNDSVAIKTSDRFGKLMYEPFILTASISKIRLVFSIEDDISQPKDIKDVMLKLNAEGTAPFQTALVLNHSIWEVSLNTHLLLKGKTYFMQVQVKDPVTGIEACYPNSNTETYMRSNWSFTVK